MAVGITFVSLRAIIRDLMNIIRGSQVVQSEPITERQVEAWVHQYRAKLIKQDVDKGRSPDPEYIQEIQGLKLSPVDEAEGVTNISDGDYILKSDLTIPATINFANTNGLTYVGTIDGHELMFISESRYKWQKYKKYTKNDPVVWHRNGYLYVSGEDNLKYLTVRGVFEIPTEVSNFVNPQTGTTSAGYDDAYPIPINLLPTLKEMILSKELGIESQAWSDDKNDSDHKTAPNVEQGIQERSKQNS